MSANTEVTPCCECVDQNAMAALGGIFGRAALAVPWIVSECAKVCDEHG
jgi:hypothetical protein